jgi:hypothetical protein
MTEQLKPCPCGKEPHLYTDSFDNGMSYGVECTACYLHTPYSDSVIKAMSDWNDHPMHKKDEEIAELKDKITSLRVHLSVIGKYVHDKVSYALEVQ